MKRENKIKSTVNDLDTGSPRPSSSFHPSVLQKILALFVVILMGECTLFLVIP